MHDALWILTVVAVEPVGKVRVEDWLPNAPPDLERLHAAVERVGDHDLHVEHARPPEHVEQDCQDGLSEVGPLHHRQRQRNIVDRDRHFHPGMQLGAQRLGLQRIGQGVADRGFAVGQAGYRGLWVDHARSCRELCADEVFAVPEQALRRGALQFPHATRIGNQGLAADGVGRWIPEDARVGRWWTVLRAVHSNLGVKCRRIRS